MSRFAISIAFLSTVQAALVLAPQRRHWPVLDALAGRAWALAPPLSLAVVIAAIALDSASADLLTWLALVVVPPLAALALGVFGRGARPGLALLAGPILALAWAAEGTLGGDLAALALSALACVTLGAALAELVPGRWLSLGIYAMAALDTYLVATDLLQGPNSVLVAAAPGPGLPQLQAAHVGDASLGFGDLFVAATVGALLARHGEGARLRGALLALALALSFDLLFFFVDELPATVPMAATLAAFEQLGRRRAPASRRPEPASRLSPEAQGP